MRSDHILQSLLNNCLPLKVLRIRLAMFRTQLYEKKTEISNILNILSLKMNGLFKEVVFSWRLLTCLIILARYLAIKSMV